MNSVKDWGFDIKPFPLICSHCIKPSKQLIYFNLYQGVSIPDIAKEFGFHLKVAPGGGMYVMCSRWCKWRHGKKNGIHFLLNFLGHKSNAWKE